jgi:hypothetical protein
MPLKDRTGPRGAGPLTGRGFGYCNRFYDDEYYGRGFGLGRGRGRGLGYWYPYQEADSLESLENELKLIESEKASLEKRLKEFKK